MNTFTTPILYVKSGCPWCEEALAFFKSNNIQLESREVRRNKVFMDQMVEHSGQTKAPTFVLGDFVVADFDVNEFRAAVELAPKVKAHLGIR
jgi:glutaredoxin